MVFIIYKHIYLQLHMISMDIQEGSISEIYVITYWGEMEIKETNEKSNEKGKKEKRLVL